MDVRIDLSTLRQTQWYEYALRFLFGGLITAVAGLIAKHFGPAVGGLFLAFPAIFPASATLIEKHERQRAQRDGQAAENSKDRDHRSANQEPDQNVRHDCSLRARTSIGSPSSAMVEGTKPKS